MSNITETDLYGELNELFNECVSKPTNSLLNKNKTKLVLCGGGIKGIAHIGALHALDEIGMLKNIDTYSGTSVGALLSLLLIIGYTANEIYDFICQMDLDKIKEFNVSNLFTEFGLDDGKKMIIVIEKILSSRGISSDVTFLKLYELTKKTFYVTATCLNDKKNYYYSHLHSPDMKVITAIRMSISIPIYFTPVKYKGKLYIDGGCIYNLPIQIFDHCLDDVLAIYFVDSRDNINDINNIEDVLIHTIQCLIEGLTLNTISGYGDKIIKIDLGAFSAFDFRIDKNMKQKLFDCGYSTIMQL